MAAIVAGAGAGVAAAAVATAALRSPSFIVDFIAQPVATVRVRVM